MQQDRDDKNVTVLLLTYGGAMFEARSKKGLLNSYRLYFASFILPPGENGLHEWAAGGISAGL